MDKYYIKEDNREVIYGLLQTLKTFGVKNKLTSRKFLEAVYFIMRTGAQWRELPTYYGKWRSVHKRFEQWTCKGLWSNVLNCITKDFDGESEMMDSISIRVRPCAAGYNKGPQVGQCLGRGKGGFTTKIHAVHDASGQALRLTLTEGQRNDITQASTLLQGIKNTNVIADKGYEVNTLIVQLEKQDCTVVILPESNRKILREYDKNLYKERHLVECFFNKIKHYRRIFSRFDRKASSFMAFIACASFILWLRYITRIVS